MNYRYDNEYNNGNPVTGGTPPPETDIEQVPDAAAYSTAGITNPAPVYYTPAPLIAEPEPMAFEPMASEPSVQDPTIYSSHAYAENEQPPQQNEDWREPSYYEVQRSQEQVYTPGLGNVQFYAPPRRESPRRETTDNGAPRKARRGGRFIRALCLVVVCAVVSAVAGVGSVHYAINSGLISIPATQVVLGATATPPPTTIVDNGETPNVAVTTEGVLSGPEIYGMATQQVVGISTEIANQGGYNSYFSGGSSSIYGTGFIISGDGYILTNYHVVAEAYQYGVAPQVILRDGTTYSARIVGFETTNDVAVIKIDATGLSPVKIGSSDNVQVGETIYAVGNPNQLDYTITGGIVSALDREVQVESGVDTITMFQISAPVNSGNSGGPVYNERGEVIGIVSAKYMSTGTEGLGFAIPIDDAMDIAGDLITVGYVTGKAQLGVSVQTMTEANAEYYGTVPGAFVFTVVPGSCSEKAGVRPGDIITKLNDAVIKTSDDLKTVLADYKAGDTVTLELYRDSATKAVSVTFDEQKTTPNTSQSVDIPSEG